MIPFISQEVIDSIRDQHQKQTLDSDGDTENTYLVHSVKDIKEENPNLFTTICDTASMYKRELLKHNIDDSVADSFYLNIIGFATCIYQTIKQQMICDELENG